MFDDNEGGDTPAAPAEGEASTPEAAPAEAAPAAPAEGGGSSE